MTSQVLLKGNGVAVLHSKFEPGAAIHAPIEIEVKCVGAHGFVSIGGKSLTLRAGDLLEWLAGINYCLWTEDAAMETLMIERLGDMS